MKVCVLMNCYNGSKYLQQALDSVLQQTHEHWELVFWDNQSTDESRDIVLSYNDKRIRYFLAPRHTNLAEARKLASEQFTGDWIGFLDCDDVWFPNKLERQLESVENDISTSVGLIYARARLLVEPGFTPTQKHVFQTSDLLPEGRIFSRLIKGNFIALPSILVRKSAFDDIGGFVGRYPIMEDYSLSLRVARRYRVRVVDQELCGYRLHGANDSLTGPEIDSFEDLEIVRGFYPDPRALAATLRIVMRHLRNCYRQQRAPAISQIFRTLTLSSRSMC